MGRTFSKAGAALERQADILLFGHSTRRVMPDGTATRHDSLFERSLLARNIKPYGKNHFGVCEVCGGVRSALGARRCLPCYREGATLVAARERGQQLLAELLDRPTAHRDDHLVDTGESDREKSALEPVDNNDPLSILIALETED